MDDNFENYLMRLNDGKSTFITKERILTDIAVCIQRNIIELQELEKKVLSEKSNTIFPLLVLGTQLEVLKNEILEINHNYQKKL